MLRYYIINTLRRFLIKMDDDLLRKSKKDKYENNAQIPFRNLLDFIECGEEAKILLNGKTYKIGVKLNNQDIGIDNYYVNEKEFCHKQELLDFIYKDSSVQLTDNSVITILSIGDGIKVDATWFKDNKNLNIQESKFYKFTLFRNIVFRFCITWIILGIVILLLIKRIDFLELKQIVTILLGILIYIITYLPKNINRLKILIKYKKQQINEIEKFKKNNCFGDICFLENYLIKIEKHYFETIKYDDISWIFKEVYYSKFGSKSQEFNSWLGFKNYGQFIFITKDKKIHKMGYMSKEQIFKNKILEKNPNILFGRSNTIIKKIKQLYDLNIYFIDFKIVIKDLINSSSFLFILYWIFNLIV